MTLCVSPPAPFTPLYEPLDLLTYLSAAGQRLDIGLAPCGSAERLRGTEGDINRDKKHKGINTVKNEIIAPIY